MIGSSAIRGPAPALAAAAPRAAIAAPRGLPGRKPRGDDLHPFAKLAAGHFGLAAVGRADRHLHRARLAALAERVERLAAAAPDRHLAVRPVAAPWPAGNEDAGDAAAPAAGALPVRGEAQRR